MSTSERKVLAFVVGLFVALALAIVSSQMCVSAWLSYGVTLDECPAGDVHPVLNVDASSLRRGQKGTLTASADMMYVVGNSANVMQERVKVKDVEYTLVRGDKSIPLKLDFKDAPHIDDAVVGYATLPADLGDGDYILKAKGKTRAGAADVDVNLPIYAPAKIHVVTDRPLYEPGHTIKYRAVVLRARDLVPLDNRPGKWIVVDPLGTVVLDEKSDAADFGIAEGEFPLDKSSPVGTWHVKYQSGDAVDDVTVEVKPFELPRFTVEVETSKPFYRAKDEPKVRVHVAYASGVPARTALSFEWSAGGAWPAPPEWVAQFPKTGRTDGAGRAELVLPRVPPDLIGKATVSVIVEAVDDTGDRKTGYGAVQLAQDAIDVAMVTELGQNGELVEGVNNRAYLRATTAAGEPLANVSLVVKRAWDHGDKGTTVETDEDGVAAMQIDPGPAVNIVVPPMPVRLPPPPQVVERTSLQEELNGEANLADTAAIDRWNPLVARCARFAGESGSVDVQVRVTPSGQVARVAAAGLAGPCVEQQLARSALSAGSARIFRLGYALNPSLALLSYSPVGDNELPQSVSYALERAALDARECLGRMTTSHRLPRLLVWEVAGNRYSADMERDGTDSAAGGDVDNTLLDDGRTRCIEAKLAPVLRARVLRGVDATNAANGSNGGDLGGGGGENDEDGNGAQGVRFGAVRFDVVPVAAEGGQARPQATTMLGYELAVTARAGDELVGDTKVRVSPGVVPAIRLRASKVIAEPGDEVVVDILRGPEFHGELPEKLFMTGNGLKLGDGSTSIESVVDKKTKQAKFVLPKDNDGWYEVRFDVSGQSAVARIFVPKRDTLLVDVAPDKKIYRPGEKAKLTIATRGGAKKTGVKAAVGLFGVDNTLAQLAPLPGPGAMERLAATVDMTHPAFGSIDATALALGRVRGKNAAAATVLLVSNVPSPAELDSYVNASASTPFNALLPLADRFYTVLDALYRRTRAFEQKAPPDEKITPQKMLALWDEALDEAGKKNDVTDAFGRKLKLQILPDDLVALTDPRLVVADGTRLPEDVEAWIPFVRRSAR